MDNLKYSEFRRLKSLYPDRFLRFKNHISDGGRLKYFGILLSLYLNFIPVMRRLPVIGWAISVSKGLFYGHISEQIYRDKTDNTSIVLRNTSDVEKEYDWIILGSGPGAAIAAKKLPSEARILVLDAGNLPNIPHNAHHTLTQVMSEFNKSAQELIIANPLAQFAQAKVIGGGSEINSGLYHRLPTLKLEKFTNELAISIEQYLEAERVVENILRPQISDVDSLHSVIARGAANLDLEFQNIPKWRTYDAEGKFIQHGMIETIWRSLCSCENFTLISGSKVKRIYKLPEDIYEVKFKHTSGEEFKVKTRNLVVSVGTIETPYLLAQSGLISWSQTSFQWHPMLRILCNTEESALGYGDIDPFQAWNEDLSLKFGSAVSTPGLLAIGLNKFVSDEELKLLRSYYFSFVSTGKGGLIPKTNIPWYTYSNVDRKMMFEGIEVLKKLVISGGALGIYPYKKNPSTVHIFGSLPPSSGIFISGTNKIKGHKNLYVADGSLLPFGPGVNPQAVIMSTVEALFNPENHGG